MKQHYHTMPIPPPPPPFVWGAAAAAAKVAVKEYLPVLSSASLATWFLQWLWQRVPDWIKEDVVWRRQRSNSTVLGEYFASSNARSPPSERLSTVWERHRQLVQVAESLLPAPVPYWPAALWAYLHRSSTHLRRQVACIQRRNQVYALSGPMARASDLRPGAATWPTLRKALSWAVAAYHVVDSKENNNDTASDNMAVPQLDIIQRIAANRPGSVGYFVGLSSSDNLLVIAIKGTSSLEDILTDTAGRAVPFYHDDHAHGHDPSIEVRGRTEDEIYWTEHAHTDHHHLDESSPHPPLHTTAVEVISGHERVLFGGGDTTAHLPADDSRHVRCHEGMLLSAHAVAREVQTFVQDYVLSGPRYRLCLVGHSLGASVASLVALLLRSRFPALAHFPSQQDDDDDACMHVYAFGPPPVVDYDTAVACSSYVTTVVHEADLIPRCSLVNLAVGLEILRTISQRLEAAGVVPAVTPPQWAKLFQYIHGTADCISFNDKTAAQPPLLSVDQIWKTIQDAREYFPLRHPEHCKWRFTCDGILIRLQMITHVIISCTAVYIPGKVLLFYRNWEQVVGPVSDGESMHRGNQGAEVANANTNPYICRVTNGLALALQTFEIDGFRCLGDHTTAAYDACLAGF